MKLNRKELRKIQYDFNSYSNRLLQANYQDYAGVLAKFVRYIDGTPIISDYIHGCGSCEWDLEKEIKEVQGSYGRLIFSLGETDGEEIRNVYAVLRYLVENNSSVYHGVAMDILLPLNGRIKSKVLMNGLLCADSPCRKVFNENRYCMGIDEKNVYNVTVQNGQAIIANDNSSVTATTNIGATANEIEQLITAVRTKMDTLTSDEE